MNSLVLFILAGIGNNPANVLGPLMAWAIDQRPSPTPVLRLWAVRAARHLLRNSNPLRWVAWASVEALNGGSLPRMEPPVLPPEGVEFRGTRRWGANDGGGWWLPLREAIRSWYDSYGFSVGRPEWNGDSRAKDNAAALESAAAILSQLLDDERWDALEAAALAAWKAARERRDRTDSLSAKGFSTDPRFEGWSVGDFRRYRPGDVDLGILERWVDETYPTC